MYTGFKASPLSLFPLLSQTDHGAKPFLCINSGKSFSSPVLKFPAPSLSAAADHMQSTPDPLSSKGQSQLELCSPFLAPGR